MQSHTRKPNTALADLLTQSGWNTRQLASAVNRVGAECGLSLHYDDSAVHHWLSGTMPRAAVRPCVLEAFARRLHRPVTSFQAGFTDSPDPARPSTDTVAGLVDLGSADMDPTRRGVLAAGLYSAALAIPGWQDVSGRFELLRRDSHVRIGSAEVEAVRQVTERISDLDDQFGGRMARPLAAAFLVNTIAPYLAAEAPADVRQAMLSAAADHCYLTGYMAMDERADALAQSYWVQALNLAGAAEDHLTYCTTLRGMSVQAVDLGHSRLSLRLAESASAASPQAGPRMLAFLAGQQAHAAAQSGYRAEALANLAQAETAMDRAESQSKPFGSYDPSSLNYHVAQVRYELGDKEASIAILDESARLQHSSYRRARIRRLGMIAERKLEIGRLEEACGDWNRMLDDYPQVQSGRADDKFRIMMAAIRPHQRNPHARALHERARTLVRPKA